MGGPVNKDEDLTSAQKLACLAQRIPIEFLSAVYASQVSDLEKEQVHSHMRVVLKVDRSLETMVTTSPSEPVLSEAAYSVMSTRPQFRPPRALQTILNGFAVNKGELGELIVALLFIMARDNAVGPADPFGRPLDNKRWCSLTGLLTSLFCTPPAASDDHVSVATSKGWHFIAESLDQTELPLADTFKDSKVYFTHFIKVHQHALVHVEYLMRLMARGAAVLCANGQPGVDGIIPFLFEGDEIKPDNIGVIMFQVKNDVKYTSFPRLNLFHAMDPFSVEILSHPTRVPVIRIVFALAATTPTIRLPDYPITRKPLTRRASASTSTKKSYTTFDFWVSGLSSTILAPIGNDEESTWDSLLKTSYSWGKIYTDDLELPTTERTTQRRMMNSGAATDSEFWENWCSLVPPLASGSEV